MYRIIVVFSAVVVLTFMRNVASASPIVRQSDDSGTIYLGAVADQDWGRPIASGDLDGDGYDDIIVGASESFGGITSQVFVMRGGPGATGSGVIDLASTGADLVISGAAADDNLGSSIATGDVNGDGVDDLLLCASNATYSTLTSAGIAYVLFGGPGFFASATRSMATTSDWDVRIVGPVPFGDLGGSNAFGGADTNAAAIGNLNGDIYDDMALGVHLADGNQSQNGRVYIVFGEAFVSGTTQFLSTPAFIDVVLFGQGEFDEFGDYVTTGDITGDGIDELIVPNHYYSQGVFTSEGAVLAFRGRASWPSSINLASASADITVLGDRNYDSLGEAAAIGDFNSDGVMDLAIGAPGVDLGAQNTSFGDGYVYGLLGRTSFQTGTHTIDYASAVPDFLITGESLENLGVELSAGDFDGDGIDDIAAVQRFAGPQTNGTIDVVFGRSFTAGQTFAAGIDTDVRIIGQANDRIGFSIGVGDTDSNGIDEIVFGTPFNNGAFPDTYGTAYVANLVDGDFDADGDHDLTDYAAMQFCLGQPINSTSDACYVFDAFPDGMIDQSDYPAFISQVSGPQ